MSFDTVSERSSAGGPALSSLISGAGGSAFTGFTKHFESSGGEGGIQALANAKLPADMRLWLSDPEGDKAYPIASYTWMMFYKKYDDPKKAAAIHKMID